MRKTNKTIAEAGVRKGPQIVHCGWASKLAYPLNTSMENSHRAKNKYSTWPPIAPLSIVLHRCLAMFIAALFTTVMKWKQLKYPSADSG